MKKLIAFILCFVMTVTALPVFAFADDTMGGVEAVSAEGENKEKVTAVSARSTDSYPVSIQEIEKRLSYYWEFQLEKSMAGYEIEVLLSDGSCHIINGYDPFELSDNDIAIDETASTQKPAGDKANSGNAVDEGPLVYGRAYIEGSQCRAILDNRNATVCTVTVMAKVYEYRQKSGKYEKTGEYKLTFEKPLVEGFALIKPVSGLPKYLNEGSESAELSDTVFEITYYDGTVKQEKPVYVGYKTKKNYTLDGREMTYKRGRGNSKTIVVTYLDGSCFFDVEEIKEYPFWDVEIKDCVFEGDRLTEITYTIINNDFKTTETYTKQVTDLESDPNGEYIDFIDGYYVRVDKRSTTKFTSLVWVTVNGVSDEVSYAHDYDNIFMNLIAKIVVFFQRIVYRVNNYI